MSPQPRNTTTLQATRITHTTNHTACRRCGITITYERIHRYQGACNDCAPYYNIAPRRRTQQ